MSRLAVIGIALILLSPAGAEDNWPAAVVTEVFSESRDWFVRVTPGRSLGDTVGFAGSPKGPYAKAAWYRQEPTRSYRFVQEVTLANPVAPVKFLVTDRGYLVTFDNWHNMGYGKVVASYDPTGRRVAAFELKDLFTPAEVTAFSTSTSSIWWRKDAAYIREGQQSVDVVIDDKGASLIYEAETGQWQYCENRDIGFRCRTTNEPRTWAPFREPPVRR